MFTNKIYDCQFMINNFVQRIFLIFFMIAFYSCEKNHGKIFNQNDIWIKNGSIVDGTGSRMFFSDIVINGDSISYIGKVSKDINAKKIIDAKGMLVSPGFIDSHSHGNPFKTPLFENFTSMGVTTITLGQDGTSPSVDPYSKWASQIEDLRLGPNIASLVGHGSLRMRSGIGYKTKPTDNEIKKIKSLLRDDLSSGAFGMSTGLEYVPGRYAQQSELNALAKTVGEFNGVIMSHMRTENNSTMELDLQELFGQGDHSNVHISHIKVVYGKGIERANEILNYMKVKRQSSKFSVTADIYPYLASYTTIGILFPEYALPPNNYSNVLKNRRSDLLSYVYNKVIIRNGPEATLFGTAPYKGLTLKEVSDSLNRPFQEIIVDIIGPNGAGAAYFTMDKDLQYQLMKDENIAISSDGSPTMYHPRGYGSFAKIIEQFVLKENIFSIEEAVRKMTSLPASLLGIQKRGKILVGYKADILIFDPIKIKSNATFSTPHLLASGFDNIIINGKTEIGSGILLRK